MRPGKKRRQKAKQSCKSKKSVAKKIRSIMLKLQQIQKYKKNKRTETRIQRRLMFKRENLGIVFIRVPQINKASVQPKS